MTFTVKTCARATSAKGSFVGSATTPRAQRKSRVGIVGVFTATADADQPKEEVEIAQVRWVEIVKDKIPSSNNRERERERRASAI